MTTEFDIDAAPDFSLEKLLTRAQTSEGALSDAANARRDTLARLTDFVRDLSAANGDMRDRIEELETSKQQDAQNHADEVADLLERLRNADNELNAAIGEAATQMAGAKARELELTGELSKISEQYGLLGREFQRFVEQVETETLNSVESERSISLIENQARSFRASSAAPEHAASVVRTVPAPVVAQTVQTYAPSPVPVPLAPRDNLIMMPAPAQRSGSEDAMDEVSEMLRARDGFGDMFNKGA